MTTILIVAGLVLVAALIAWLLVRNRRTSDLRDRYGDEYDRTVDARGGRSAGETDLIEREKRVSEFKIRPLTIEEHERFSGEWTETKALFVDSPREALLRGDRLLANMMDAKGFPMNDFDRRYEDLTVNHGDVARNYREGHEIAQNGEATTEEMRRGFNQYDKLFDELTRDAAKGDVHDDGRRTTAVDAPGRTVDTDGDGHADGRTVDVDGDGRAEARTVDVDGDGDADALASRPVVTRPAD